MASNKEIDEIKSRVNAVELIGEYIRLEKAGTNYRALCPFHNEKSPSFMVNEEKQIWHCFGCGKGGDVFTFVADMEGVGFKEALEMLATRAGVKLEKQTRSFADGSSQEAEVSRIKLFQIMELATRWYEKNLWEGRDSQKILGYLRERGLQDETIRKFRLGYAPDGWRNILEFLTKRGYSLSDIEKTGLLVKKDSSSAATSSNSFGESNFYDRFRERIMFPVQDIVGRVVGYSARVAPGGDEKSAKYVNTPQSALYDKSRVLYGLYFAKVEIKKKNEVILVEGNMDVIASHQGGFSNTIAVSGTALTQEQIKIIKRYTDNIRISFDMDEAGRNAAKKSAKLCLESDINVKVIQIPKGKDAADSLREDPGSWQKAIEEAQNITEYYLHDVLSRYNPKDPVDKKKIASEMLNIIKDIASPIEQSHWLKILSEIINTEEKVLVGVLNAVKNKEGQNRNNNQNGKDRGQSANIFSLEKRIIGLLLAFPSESRREVERLDPEDFTGKLEKEIVGEIKGDAASYSLEKLRSFFANYEAEKLIKEAVFEVEVEYASDISSVNAPKNPSEELRECLIRLKKRNLKDKVERLSADIRLAEASGDREAVSVLMNEFQNLSSQLND